MTMIALFTAAALCLAFAAFSFFGLPFMMAGHHMLDQLRERLSHKTALGGLIAAAIALVWVLQASPVLISPGAGVQVVADQMTGSSWQI